MEKYRPVVIDNNNNEYYVIKLDKKYLETATRQQVKQLVNLATSQFFLPLKNDNELRKINNVKSFNRLNILIFMEMAQHYTGGRYSIVHQAILLGEYYNVTVVTDNKIIFINDFKNYIGFENVNFVIDSSWLSNITINKFDIIIGIPNMSAQYAKIYSEKWKIPFYCYMFESPNYVSMFRDGIDSTEEYWKSFKKAIESADVRISPSKISSEYLKKWIGIDNDTFKVIYPCVNENVKITNNIFNEYKDDIIFIGRSAKFKNPIEIIVELNRRGWKGTVHVVGKIWDLNEFKNVVKKFKNTSVKIHGNVNDVTKFKLIKSCKLLIFPSKFEGFGMPPLEAIFCKKPCIAYKIPVLEEVYGDKIVYPKENTAKSFVKSIFEVISNYKDYERKVEYPYNLSMKKCQNNLISLFDKKYYTITAGILAFNCLDYLPYVIKSIYSYVDEIIIIEGAVKGNEKYSRDGHSIDGTLEYLKAIGYVVDPLNKITVIVKNDNVWHDKIEMQNEIAKRVNTDFYMKVDADEIWDGKDIITAKRFLIENKDIHVLRFPFIHYWTSFNIVAKDAGGKWSTEHPRMWRWRNGFRHLNSFNFFVDKNSDYRKVGNPFYKEFVMKDICIHHFGYARELKYVRQKLSYYAQRGIEKIVIKGIYENWKNLNDKTQPTQNVRSWAEEIYDTVPSIMKNHEYYNVNDIRK